jgi:hypothetical protein
MHDNKKIIVAHPSLNMLLNNNNRHAGDAQTCLYLDGCEQSAPQLPKTHQISYIHGTSVDVFESASERRGADGIDARA